MDESELRMLLEMIPIKILREIAYKYDVKVKARRTEDLVNAIIEKVGLREDFFKELQELVKMLNEEEEPVAQYVLKIVGDIDLSELKSKFENQLARFDDSGNLEADGYEVIEHRVDILRARRWTKKTYSRLDFRGRPRRVTNVDRAEVTVDTETGMILIEGRYGLARKIKRELAEFGVEMESAGLMDLERDKANRRFQEFIDKLESELRKGG